MGFNSEFKGLSGHETGINVPKNVEANDFRRYLASGTSLFSVQQ